MWTRLAIALLAAASVEAARIEMWALAGTMPDGQFDYEAVSMSLGDAPFERELLADIEYGVGAYDFARASTRANRTSFHGTLETLAGWGPGRLDSAISEADIYWESAPILVSSSRAGRGYAEVSALCVEGADNGRCESNVDLATSLLEIEFNVPIRLWAHINAWNTSAEDQFPLSSSAIADVDANVIRVFDADMNPVTDYSAEFLSDIPEPTTWWLVLSGIGVAAGVRRQARRTG